jgi:hypothetical protein
MDVALIRRARREVSGVLCLCMWCVCVCVCVRLPAHTTLPFCKLTPHPSVFAGSCECLRDYPTSMLSGCIGVDAMLDLAELACQDDPRTLQKVCSASPSLPLSLSHPLRSPPNLHPPPTPTPTPCPPSPSFVDNVGQKLACIRGGALASQLLCIPSGHACAIHRSSVWGGILTAARAFVRHAM